LPVVPERMTAKAWVTAASVKFKEATDAALASAVVKSAMATALAVAVVAAVGEIGRSGLEG
jgi:hypothetical protein